LLNGKINDVEQDLKIDKIKNHEKKRAKKGDEKKREIKDWKLD
jgi:hypothetical protein